MRPRIALVAPFTGPRAEWGGLLTESVRALPYAQVEWVWFDDRGDAATAAERAAEIAGDGGFAAVVGHFNSAGAAAALAAYHEAGLVLLLPLATAPGLLRGRPSLALRLCPSDEGQAAAIVRAGRSSGAVRLSVLDDGSDYGLRLAHLVVTGAGGILTTREGPAADEPVAVCGVHHRVADIVRELPGHGPVFVPDDCDIGEFAMMVGPAAARVEVARLVGGPLARVNAACAAAAAVLTKYPAERGPQLRQRIRHELGQRFDHDGELTDTSYEWELRPLTRPAARGSTGARAAVAVVGAGIVGRTAAAELAEAGAHVVLIDPADPVRSASAPSGGLVRAFEADPGQRERACRSFAELWQRREAWAHGFRRTGSLVLLDPADLDAAGAGVAELRGAGLDAQLISAADLRRRWPALRSDAPAVWEPQAGYAVASVTLAAQLDRARAAGVQYLAGTWVCAMRPIPGGSSRLHCTGPAGPSTVDADVVLIAAGCASPELVGEGWPADRPAATKRIRYAIFGCSSLDLPTVVDLRSGVWGRPDGAGGYLAGCPIDEWHVPADSGADVGADHVQTVRTALSGLCPELADQEVLCSRYGTDLFASAPVLESLPGPTRLVVAAGWSGDGFKSAPAAGRRAAELALAAIRA